MDYGVWGEKKFMGRTYLGVHRTTFVINQNQIIDEIEFNLKKVFAFVDTKGIA